MNESKFGRRSLLISAVSAFLLMTPYAADAEEAYPTQLITFVCAFPAGSGADVMVRYFGNKIQRLTGQTVVVENKPGASGNIAAEYTARSKPDGYTVYIHSGTTTAANMSMFLKPPIDPSKDLRGVAFVSQLSMMVGVKVDSPFKDMKDLTAYLKEKGTDASFSTNSASGKIVGAVYLKEAKIDPTEISYKSAGDALNDMDSGIIDFGIFDPVTALANVRSGRIKVVGIANGTRMKSAPDLPTMKEAGLDINLDNWWAAFVAADTPEPIVNKLNELFRQVVEMPETVKFLADSGMDPYNGTPEEVQDRLTSEIGVQKALVELAQIPKN